MIQNLESTLRAGAVPQVPQFRPPSMAQSSQTATVTVDKSTASGPSPSTKVIVKEADVKVKSVDTKPNETSDRVKSAEAKGKTTVNRGDPLGDARNKVQEEIGREFAAIMATGTFRASEAAALATKRVMQRYGHLNAAMPQS